MSNSMRSGIYKIENTLNGQCYIGSAIYLPARLSNHRRALERLSHPNVKLQRAWNKYGAEAFSISIIEEVEDRHRLVIREQYWMDTLCSVRNGYNIAPVAGSSLGRTASEETRRKLSIAGKGRILSPEHRAKLIGRPVSLETRAKIAAKHLGKPKPRHTPEQRAARSAWQKGRRNSPDSTAKTAEAQKGRIFSLESKIKMSAAQRNRPPASHETRLKLSRAGMGRVFSSERRDKISAAHKGKIRRPIPEDVRLKISEALRGKPKPQGFSEKLRARHQRNRLLRQSGLSVRSEAYAGESFQQ